ncbi:helix-turn-helix transcriptional regulator [Tsukamurella tyrosinosolvens]|uniref:helix-turn-helix transcriptional regulator n=1 Tax=Tsukamurella tyrosinosolvens TaxID=57704 RepID=UPI002DD43BBC|nr:helix-turn-helix transcriptional regulator [Tsukamurella tyrosinosolvens]MEC4616320.1 helix-turn-helix transcriptional regulator [Tsukamurella tyrosinosolvens]
MKLDIARTTTYCLLTPGLHRLDARGKKVVDQTALAQRLGVSQSTVSRILMGRTEDMRVRTAGRLLDAFDGVVKFEDLFIDDDSIAA